MRELLPARDRGLSPRRQDRAQPDLAQLVVSQRTSPPTARPFSSTNRTSSRMGVYLRKLDGSPAVRIGEGDAVGFSPDGRWALSTSEARRTASSRSCRPEPESRRQLAEDRHRRPGGDLVSGRAPDPHLGQRAGTRLPALRPGHPGRQAPRHHPGGRQLPLPRRLPGRKVGRGDGTGPPDRHLPDRARRAPRRARASSPTDIPLRWTPDGTSIFVYRPSAPPLRVETVDVKTGQPHALEGAPAARSVRRRAGRPDPDRAGREVLRLLLPARARRALPRDRAALSA